MHAITYLPNSKQLCDEQFVCQFLQGQTCVLALSFSLNSSLSLFLFSLLSLSFLSCFFPLSFLSPFSLISPFSLSLFLSLLCFHYGIYLTKKLSYLIAVSLDFMQFTILKNANFNVPVHVATISQKKYVELLIAKEFTDFLCNADVNFVSVVVSIKVPYHFNQ